MHCFEAPMLVYLNIRNGCRFSLFFICAILLHARTNAHSHSLLLAHSNILSLSFFSSTNFCWWYFLFRFKLICVWMWTSLFTFGFDLISFHSLFGFYYCYCFCCSFLQRSLSKYDDNIRYDLQFQMKNYFDNNMMAEGERSRSENVVNKNFVNSVDDGRRKKINIYFLLLFCPMRNRDFDLRMRLFVYFVFVFFFGWIAKVARVHEPNGQKSRRHFTFWRFKCCSKTESCENSCPFIYYGYGIYTWSYALQHSSTHTHTHIRGAYVSISVRCVYVCKCKESNESECERTFLRYT